MKLKCFLPEGALEHKVQAKVSEDLSIKEVPHCLNF